MMRWLGTWLAGGVLALAAASAQAAPVHTGVTLSVSIEGLAAVTVTGSGTVGVSGSTVAVPAGLVAQPGPIVVPVTAATSVQSISASGIANLAGTFSLGGITGQLPAEVCASAAPGEACNAGAGVGGAMGLTGTIRVTVLDPIYAAPLALDSLGLGQGSAVTTPFLVDNAGWTTGRAFVRTDDTAASSVQATVTGAAAPLRLVTPTYLNALGNLLPVTATLTFWDVSLVPEPGAMGLLAAGATGLVAMRRRH